jgi:hypothetical protein
MSRTGVGMVPKFGGDSSTGDGLLSPEMMVKVLRWPIS